MTLEALTPEPERLSPLDQSASAMLTHRTSIGEIFLLGSVSEAGDVWSTVGQVPRSNLYFNDHHEPTMYVDPLALIEIVRQSCSCIAHTALALPTSTKFVLNELAFDLRTLRYDGLDARRSIVANTQIEVIRERRGIPQTAVFTSELYNGSNLVGRVKFETSFLTDPVYSVLRGGRTQRGGDAEGALISAPTVGVTPQSVGRRHPINVVIADPSRPSHRELVCQIQPQFSNPSMFDHAQDHVPGMVILEAVRQAAQYSFGALARPVSGACMFYNFLENDDAGRIVGESAQDGVATRSRLFGEIQDARGIALGRFDLQLSAEEAA